MKRKKTRSVASYRAAALKAQRTIKLMQQTRQHDRLPWEEPDLVVKLTDADVLTNADYRRALPNPWFDMVRK